MFLLPLNRFRINLNHAAELEVINAKRETIQIITILKFMYTTVEMFGVGKVLCFLFFYFFCRKMLTKAAFI